MPTKSEVEVVTITGKLVRVYTEKENGKEFKKLADEFAKKNGYVVK